MQSKLNEASENKQQLMLQSVSRIYTGKQANKATSIRK